jgi:hypothetical protein
LDNPALYRARPNPHNQLPLLNCGDGALRESAVEGLEVSPFAAAVTQAHSDVVRNVLSIVHCAFLAAAAPEGWVTGLYLALLRSQASEAVFRLHLVA